MFIYVDLFTVRTPVLQVAVSPQLSCAKQVKVREEQKFGFYFVFSRTTNA